MLFFVCLQHSLTLPPSHSIGKDLTDPFFEHIWSWMFTGTVDASASSSFFFIDPHIGTSPSPTPPHLNMAKFPVGVLEPRHGQTIYSIGKLVGELKANGRLNQRPSAAANQQRDCSTLRTELWRRHYANRQELYASSGCFRRFLAEVKAFVLEVCCLSLPAYPFFSFFY